MFKRRIIPILALVLAIGQGAQAQKVKTQNARKAKTTKVNATEKSDADILYEAMLPSTAKVLFIDSVVTDKATFIEKMALGNEIGTVQTYNKFFNTDKQPDAYVYMNELGNKRYYTETDAAGNMKLYTNDKLGGKWGEAQIVGDFGDEFEDVNCPFMMSDGVTLYFAAKGKHGLGGYDIYVTRYDADDARFYKPENIGLPYNSTGNDYYYIVDDFNSLGWLVTDRNQPEGKVCVYTFVPSESRNIYEGDIDDEELDKLARIASIKDTWGDGKERKDALARLAKLEERLKNSNRWSQRMNFVINDNLTYHSIDEFRTAENKQRYLQLVEKQKDIEKISTTLETMRNLYATSSTGAKRKLGEEIRNDEKKLIELTTEVLTEEKNIRNAENMALE